MCTILDKIKHSRGESTEMEGSKIKMFNFRWSSTSVSVFGCWLLAHLTHDLSQAEKKMDVVTISLKIDKDVILIEKSCHFVCCSSSNNSYFSQLKIRHVLNGPTAKNQQRCCLPGYIAYPYFPRNVRSVKKHTKRSSLLLLRLVCFFTERTLKQ